jgi:hypothetical protein
MSRAAGALLRLAGTGTTHEAADDRFYGVVDCDTAAAYAEGQLPRKRIQFVADEHQRDLSHCGSLPCCSGSCSVHM